MRKFAIFLPALSFIFCHALHAEIVPPTGRTDARVRVVNYDARNVVKLNTYYGVSSHIEFGSGENVKYYGVGDSDAWEIATQDNHMFIKPKARNGNTNMTVITDLRTYHFALYVQETPKKQSEAWASKNLVFSLSFNYPDEVAARKAMQKRIAEEKEARRDIQNRLDTAIVKRGHNTDYWVAGSEEISPTGAYDDTRFIYLIFSANRDLPAVYIADENGEESLVNTHVISGNTIAVQRLVKQLILRKGDLAAAVVNRSFNSAVGEDNVTGTVAEDVDRKINEVQP